MRKDKAEESENQSPPNEPTQFGRFENFVRRIVAVSKAEIEEEERKYRRRATSRKSRKR